MSSGCWALILQRRQVCIDRFNTKQLLPELSPVQCRRNQEKGPNTGDIKPSKGLLVFLYIPYIPGEECCPRKGPYTGVQGFHIKAARTAAWFSKLLQSQNISLWKRANCPDFSGVPEEEVHLGPQGHQVLIEREHQQSLKP